MRPPLARTAAFLALLCVACRQGEGPRITIDGEWSDWSDVPAAVTDPADNDTGPADLGEIRITHDAQSVYMRMQLGGRVVNLQAMDGTVRLLLDRDNNESTGRDAQGLIGTDLTIDFSAPTQAGGTGFGMAARLAEDSANTDANRIGLLYAPTFADSAFEIRIDRSAAFPAGSLRGRLLVLSATGEVVDETDVFEYRLSGTPYGRREVNAYTVRRVAETNLRVVTWNTASRGLTQRSDAFARILSALDADVLLLDEISARIDSAQVMTLLQRVPGKWSLVMGRGGGRQRTAVASRLPLRAADSLMFVPYPDSIAALAGEPISAQMKADIAGAPRDGIPTMGAIVTAEGRNILLVPVDFLCCGRSGSAEDRARIMVAHALHEAITRAYAEGGIDGLILGGDLNLVGSRMPLDILARALDPAGDNLALIDGLRLDGTSNATWSAPGPFPPGRLDHVLYSPSSLVALRSFTFSSGDLGAAALSELGVRAEDSSSASDHLPIVVDFRVRQGAEVRAFSRYRGIT
jgi:endonuclease/exonuclease/phosphatase family metal-dependent hydrolase